jgi:hypothetical protein
MFVFAQGYAHTFVEGMFLAPHGVNFHNVPPALYASAIRGPSKPRGTMRR